MIEFITSDKETLKAINEVTAELPNFDKLYGTYELKKIDCGLTVDKTGDNGVIGFSDRRSLMRAISVLYAHINEQNVSVSETPKYEILGAMPDASRNAVPKVETLKKFCRILALEGYNSLMLYTEDTYEMEKYPYFGHLRGRYTKEELKELDDYAALLGIELIPAIQTLAHLNGMFEWPASYKYNDCNDIMLVGSDDVYELIEDMLITIKSTFRTRKINIGLDEAKMLGSGRYLEKNGYKKRYLIMAEHMKRVKDLCVKHGFEARMWSDMFFRILNNGVYRVKGTNVPQEIIDSVPPELTLVYWDYIQPDVESYDEMFRQHKPFHNKIAFAGGVASWYGLIPLSVLAKRSSLSATESIRKNNIGEVYVTMWGDDGAACSLYSSMHSLFIYGEACWSDHENRETLAAQRLKLCTGVSESILLDLERVHDLPGREGFGKKVANPSKYMLYNNILTGKFDAHTPDGTAEHMQIMAKHLRDEKYKAGEFGYVIDSVIALCDVLALKAELGKKLYTAYHASDKTAVSQIASVDIPAVISSVEVFRKTLRAQWMKDNKSFGFDVLDMRIGGLLTQLETAKFTLEQWLAGVVGKVDELEAARLEYWPKDNGNSDGGIIQLNRWERIAGQNISNMVGYI